MGVYDYYHDSGRSDRPEARRKPLRLVWEDGRKYDIDKILRVDRCASLKAGGAGIRYVCRILGQRVELFYEENGFWFVNRKTPGP